MSEFRAHAVGRVVEDGADAFVLAENPDGSGRRLEVQRSLEPTDQDRQLGMDTYCLVTESGAAHYGGVEEWAVDGSVLSLALSERAASTLGLGTTIQIDLSAAPGASEDVAVALADLLDEH